MDGASSIRNGSGCGRSISEIEQTISRINNKRSNSTEVSGSSKSDGLCVDVDGSRSCNQLDKTRRCNDSSSLDVRTGWEGDDELIGAGALREIESQCYSSRKIERQWNGESMEWITCRR